MERKILATALTLSLIFGALGVASTAAAQTTDATATDPPIEETNVEPVAPDVKNLIVTYDDGVNRETQIDVVDDVVDTTESVVPIGENVVAVTVSDDTSIDEINTIIEDPNVKYVEEDFPVTLTSGMNLDPQVGHWQNWGVRGPNFVAGVSPSPHGSDAIGAWDRGFTGSKKSYVAVIDTGIDINHPDLAANIWANTREIPGNGVDDDYNGYIDDYNGWNTAENNNNVFPDSNSDTHGTSVAGIIGAVGGNGEGIAGVNWDVGIVPVRSMINRQGMTSWMIQAINYVTTLKLKNKVNIVAINASWGGGGFTYAMQDAIRAAGDQGILFVASAGNNGLNTDTAAHYPSNYECGWWWRSWDCVISVAAHRNDGRLASFSNFGKATVDLSAPGENVYTTRPGGSYGTFSGTSSSAPYVTGAVALCASANPSMQAEKIRETLFASTTTNSNFTDFVATGGILNVNALVQGCVGNGSDYGSITSVRQNGVNTVRVEGWVMPNGSSPQDSVLVKVDGTTVASLTMASLQNGVGFPSKLNFGLNFSMTEGRKNICVETTKRTGVDCREFAVIGGANPVGGLKFLPKTGGYWDLAGWAIDPVTTEAASVTLYVDGAAIETIPASGAESAFPRGDYPGWDHYRDFRFWWTTTPGLHNACVVAQSADGTKSTQLGCFQHYEFNGSSPVGALDTFKRLNRSQVELSGWALDPDGDSPVEIYVYVDGVLEANGSTTVSRQDIRNAFPGWTSTFGYTLQASISPTKATQDVCVYAINRGAGAAYTHLGCRTVTNTSSEPVGNIEQVKISGPGAVNVVGWAHDADTSESIPVHVYVNNKFHSAHTANVQRSDIQSVFTTAGPNHGYNINLQVSGGANNVCVFAINVEGGSNNTLLGCQTVTLPTGNPVGSTDLIRQFGPRAIQIAGWTLDPDTANPIPVHVYVNNRFAGSFTANTTRTDVGRAYPGYGNNHGFNFNISNLQSGRNNVCVFAINRGAGTTNPVLGCRTVNIMSGNPVGNFEILRKTSGGMQVAGWTLDPDTANPIPVHVYVNNRFAGSFTANTTRTDVGRAYPGYGNNHGMNFVVNAKAGDSVCVFAINRGAGTTNPVLGCRTAPAR